MNDSRPSVPVLSLTRVVAGLVLAVSGCLSATTHAQVVKRADLLRAEAAKVGRTQAVARRELYAYIAPSRQNLNVRLVDRILGQAKFDSLFPLRDSGYTYAAFLEGVRIFPTFCYHNHRDDLAPLFEKQCRRSLATLFAHMAYENNERSPWRKEPLWRQGLVRLRDPGHDESTRGAFNADCGDDSLMSRGYPCGRFADGSFKSYFGRGAWPIAGRHEYARFSSILYGDASVLLDQPERVAQPQLRLAVAIYRYLDTRAPAPSMNQVRSGSWRPNDADAAGGRRRGFGVTTLLANGANECGLGRDTPAAAERAAFYRSFAEELGVEVGDEVLGCADMRPFDGKSAGFAPAYWEKSESAGSPSCDLVAHETPFSAVARDQYVACVRANFPGVRIE